MSAPRLLSGGNPQIAKAEGRAPVEAYLAAMPDWKRPIGDTLDSPLRDVAPEVRDASAWAQALSGMDGKTSFLSFRRFAAHSNSTFRKDHAPGPVPPFDSSRDGARHARVEQGRAVDESLARRWRERARGLPGSKL